jgi:hypothetical protein
VTRKLLVATLPASSVALQVTVVTPIEKRLPEPGEHATVGEESTLSVALTLNVTTSPDELVAVRVIPPGTDMAGAVTSSKRATTVVFAVRVRVQVPVPEQPPPLQPLNADPPAALAVSVTVVPTG